MATITLNLDERSNKNGMCPVRIRVSHKGTNCFIGSGVSIEPKYFIEGSLYDMVHRKAQMAVEKRERIAEQVRMLETFLADVDRDELARMTANEIRDRAGFGNAKNEERKRSDRADNRTTKSVTDNYAVRFVCKNARCLTNKNDGRDFLRWFDEFGESRRTPKTQESYAYGGKVLREYCSSLRLHTLTFDDIDYARLADFARWLTSTGRGPSTRHMLECYVRAAYKEAQKRHMVSRDRDPYYDYSIKPVPVKDIECLTAEQMQTLMTTTMPNKSTQMGLDAALMSFFLCGANLVDLYEMPKSKAGHVEFVRHKVNGRWQKTVQIRIEPEMRALIERYGSDDRLLRFSALYGNYESFRHKIGHRLRDVSKVVGFDVNMAMIRRTWATLAAEIGCPDAVIDMCLGHIPQTVNRKHYVKPKWENAAEWNRRVIDYVLAA